MTHDPTELPPQLQDLLTLDDRGGPAPPLDRAGTDTLIGGALTAWQAAPAVPVRRRRPARLVLLAALTLGAGAAAAHYIADQGFFTPSVAEEVSAPKKTTSKPPDEVVRVSTEQAPEVVKAERATRDLLARANQLRGAGDYETAAATYSEAERSAPTASIAQVAQVAAADLQLERLGNPAQALALYEKAAAADGPLQPEAKVGVARALQALGRQDAARGVLREIQENHPSSPGARWAGEQLRGD